MTVDGEKGRNAQSTSDPELMDSTMAKSYEREDVSDVKKRSSDGSSKIQAVRSDSDEVEGNPIERVGFVCGLKSEADCLSVLGHHAMLSVSGASARRARINAEILLSKGAQGLVSFGISGALGPHLEPGDVIIGGKVAQKGRQTLLADSDWCRRIKEIARSKGIDIKQVTVFGSNDIVVSTQQKADIAQAFEADAVDMESHAVASIAADAHKPFLILRTIADSCEQVIPPAALKGIGTDGRIRPFSVATELVTRPQDLLPLMLLGRENAKAMASLRRCALEILPFFFGRM